MRRRPQNLSRLAAAVLMANLHAAPSGPAEVNLCSFGIASAVSEETDKGNLARHAIDGKPDTRWCTNGYRNDSWLMVDLGAVCKLSSVAVIWEQPDTEYKYRIEVSLDGESWSPLGGKLEFASVGTGTHIFQTRARKVRIVHKNATRSAWTSIRELQVLGLPE